MGQHLAFNLLSDYPIHPLAPLFPNLIRRRDGSLCLFSPLVRHESVLRLNSGVYLELAVMVSSSLLSVSDSIMPNTELKVSTRRG